MPDLDPDPDQVQVLAAQLRVVEVPGVSLGMNDLLPCGTDTAKRRHVALAEACDTCGTAGRRRRLPTLVELVEERQRIAARTGDAA